MGCDFDLTIQVLHGTHWVSILTLWMKTPTGGYPLTDAMWQLVQKDGVRGTYGTNYPIHEATDLSAIISCIKPELSPKKESDTAELKPEEPIRENDDKDSEEDEKSEDEYKPNYLYYSAEQFAKLIRYTGPTISMHDMSQDNLHKNGLAKIPKWFEMSKSALPINETQYDWWCGDESSVDKLLLESQDELRKQYTELLKNEFKPTSLSDETVDRTAEFALPVATDVRIQWYDCENWSEAVSKGEPAPPGTGVPPRCCIM